MPAAPDEQVSEELWRATISAVRDQVLVHAKQAAREAAPGGWVAVDADDAGAGAGGSQAWPQQQWHVAFEIMFCQAPRSVSEARPHQDDLLMFSYFVDVAARKQSPVFARRRGAGLPADLRWGGAALAGEVDWRATLLLNVVLQTRYRLDTCCCSRRDLEGGGATVTVSGGAGGAGGSAGGGLAVSGVDAAMASAGRSAKVVHASPSRVPVNLDQSKAESAAPAASYPDICFAVDDFGEACGATVLSFSEDCFCVLLHADVGGSWGSAAGWQCVGAEAAASGPPAPPAAEVLLFSGYVGHAQISAALAGRLHSPLRALRGERADTSRVRMRGPGGVGSAEVALTALAPGDAGDAGISAGVRPGAGASSPVPKLLRGASRLARNVVQAARAAAEPRGEGPPRLRCALMTLAMPVDALAEYILQAM